ncbi:MAG TPA: EamA family transporter [Bacillota bacterium]|nr:EamA family transporter [Bacillota bacterium]
MKDSKNQAVLYMMLCAVLWSTAGILIKFLPWNPLVIAGFRSLISAGIYLLYMRYEKAKFKWNRDSVTGGLALMGTFIFFVAANKFTTSANAIVLQYSAPIFILILSAVVYRQKFRMGDVLTVAVTSAGISLFFLDKLSGGYLMGNLFGLAAGVSFASMFVVTGHADDDSRASGILLGHVFTAIVGIPFAFFSPTPVTLSTVAVIVAMGVFQLGIPYILYGIAVRRCSPLACSLISVIEPLLNPLWVFLFNGEAPGFFALIGGVVVISAVAAWSVWSGKKEREAAQKS